MPSANLRIPGSQTTEERLRVECIDCCDIATKGECREVRPCQPRHPDASFVRIVTHDCHSLSGINAIVWLHLFPQWKETERKDFKLLSFCTMPANVISRQS